MDLVNAHMSGLPKEQFTRYQGWASDILNTGVLAIVICAPLGLLIIGAHRAAADARALDALAHLGHVCKGGRSCIAIGLT